jgi:glycosyltransferase involved in cell wall biosynthesis
MRIAFFTPLNPIQSGISDYSEELLPVLARGATVEIYIDKYRPTNAAITRQFAVRPAAEFPAVQRAAPYDSIVYQMGNSPAHAYIYEMLARYPGVVVLHEFVLHHLRMWMALNAGRGGAYLAAMADAYGEPGRALARRVLVGQHPAAMFDYPLVEEALGRATAVIVHSAYMAERVRAIRPAVPLAVVPMGVPLPPLIPKADARARLGLDPDEFIVSSVGHLNPYKRISVVLRAFKALVMQVPRARYLLVGSPSPNFNVGRMIGMLGLEREVQVVGYAPPAQFADYLAASDVCANLRYPTAGETSAALLRIMGAGLPVLVSDTGAFTELPDAAVGKVDIGGLEEEVLLEYLLLLARRPDVRAAMGRAARRTVATGHTLEAAARGYLIFLATLTGQPVDLSRIPVPSPPADDLPLDATPPPTESRQPPTSTAQPPAPASVLPLALLAEAATELGLAPDDPVLAQIVERIKPVL